MVTIYEAEIDVTAVAGTTTGEFHVDGTVTVNDVETVAGTEMIRVCGTLAGTLV
jgi:hypothetical protein